MAAKLIEVEGLVATDPDHMSLRHEPWSFALDQRAFGPRKLMVAFADELGRFVGLTYVRRPNPPEDGIGPCVQHMLTEVHAMAAVAFCDEPVSMGPPPEDLAMRLATARVIASSHGVHLVDWICCDDEAFRSMRMALDPEDSEWWDVPS